LEYKNAKVMLKPNIPNLFKITVGLIILLAVGFIVNKKFTKKTITFTDADGREVTGSINEKLSFKKLSGTSSGGGKVKDMSGNDVSTQPPKTGTDS
jgi:hypothetical protein